MDYLAGLFEILAKIIIGKKCKWGWLLSLCSGMLWTIIAFRTGVYGLLVIAVPAYFVNTYNFIKWHKKEKRNDWFGYEQ